MKIVVCSHCVLNQNAKLEGLAGWPGMIDEVIEVIRKADASIFQMPCPEMSYEGIGRFDKSIEQYQCFAFKKLCEGIAKDVIDQLENYIQWGYKIPVILAIDGSPACGLKLAQSAPEWRGLVAGMNWKKVRFINQSGVYIKILQDQLEQRHLEIPILGLPEVPELGSLDEVLKTLVSILKNQR